MVPVREQKLKPSTAHGVHSIPTKEIVFGGVRGQPTQGDMGHSTGQHSNAFMVKLQSKPGRSRPGTAQSSADLMEQWSQNLQHKKRADDKWEENYSRKTPTLDHVRNSGIGTSRPVSAISAMPVNEPGYDETPRVGLPHNSGEWNLNEDVEPQLTDSFESFQSASQPGHLQSESADSMFSSRRGRSRTKPMESKTRNRFRSESNESSSAERSNYTSDWSRDSSREKYGSRDPSREKYFSRDSSIEKFGSRDSSKENRRSREHSLEKPHMNGVTHGGPLDSMGIAGQAIKVSSHGNLSDTEKSLRKSRGEDDDPSFDTMLPSEYVNQDHNDSFDGRKMGLSKQNFDEALSKMLGTENLDPEASLTFAHEQYNSFARVPRNKSHSKVRDRSQSAKVSTGGASNKSPYTVPQHLHIEPQQRPKTSVHKEHQHRPKSSVHGTWGPEAKVSLVVYENTGLVPFIAKKNIFILQNEY